jgi:hypothetical protein
LNAESGVVAILQTRIKRLERLQRTSIRGYTYTMPDKRQFILNYRQHHKAFADACSGIDSTESRIVRDAVTDNNHGLMLSLLRAVINHVNTETTP